MSIIIYIITNVSKINKHLDQIDKCKRNFQKPISNQKLCLAKYKKEVLSILNILLNNDHSCEVLIGRTVSEMKLFLKGQVSILTPGISFGKNGRGSLVCRCDALYKI